MSKRFLTEDLVADIEQQVWCRNKIKAAYQFLDGPQLYERLREIEREFYWGWDKTGNVRER